MCAGSGVKPPSAKAAQHLRCFQMPLLNNNTKAQLSFCSSWQSGQNKAGGASQFGFRSVPRSGSSLVDKPWRRFRSRQTLQRKGAICPQREAAADANVIPSHVGSFGDMNPHSQSKVKHCFIWDQAKIKQKSKLSYYTEFYISKCIRRGKGEHV